MDQMTEKQPGKQPDPQNEAAKSFQPPRHWMVMDELKESYWNDPAEQEVRGQEFFKKPIESLEQLEKMPEFETTRRGFLSIMTAATALSATACMRRPVNKIVPYVNRPEEVLPGVAYHYASTCGECASACGILTKNREGRPIKLEGNPDHPKNQGALCARGQGSLLNLYDPDRLKGPQSNKRGQKNSAAPATWAEVDAKVKAALEAAQASGGGVRILSEPISSPSTRKLIQQFLAKSKNSAWIEYAPTDLDEIARSQGESYGTPGVVPSYHFDQADVIVSFAADFLSTWGNSVENSKNWAKGRRVRSAQASQAKMSKLHVFESILSTTGANSDSRHIVGPGQEFEAAMAVACELIVNQKRSRYAGNAVVTAALESYQPAKVAAASGGTLKVEGIRHAAEDLWEARGRSLVVAGGISSRSAAAVELQNVVNLLNSALENEGKTVDGTGAYSLSTSSGLKGFDQLKGDLLAGKVDVLILHATNPVYWSGKGFGIVDAIGKAKLVVSTADRVNETALLADVVAPDHHYLENWGDASPVMGLYSLQQPAVAPLEDTRSFQDSLIQWMGGEGTWYDFLQTNWREVIQKEAGVGGDFTVFWEKTLQKGVLDLTAKRSVRAREFKPGVMRTATTDVKGDYSLVFYEKAGIGDGRSANNPWMQEFPDPVSTATWDNYVLLAPATAAKFGLVNHDVVRLKAVNLDGVDLPVVVQPGLHPKAVAVAIGYGRQGAGRVGDGVGISVFPATLAAASGTVHQMAGFEVTMTKTGRRYEVALTQGHFKSENRPIINDITLADFKKNPKTANHTDPHLRLDVVPSIWKSHDYRGAYRWGMAIDLNACTGCSACVIACQAENNIPSVGRQNVRVGREMHWIRLDRYYSGDPAAPEMIFQPMLCQHCENAHCETVCPVLATVHSDEGLNDMSYNRCVGTRYCQNNCAYKVRRFNFFDHWKAYAEPMNQVFNPDVTVRTRGVMEKCSFCIQRIQSSKGVAKDQGRKVKDGELKTACQQTCPTEAIVFGNINDPDSQVSKLRKEDHAFVVLEVLNTKPSISYLSKVRNQAKESHGNEGHGKEKGADHGHS